MALVHKNRCFFGHMAVCLRTGVFRQVFTYICIRNEFAAPITYDAARTVQLLLAFCFSHNHNLWFSPDRSLLLHCPIMAMRSIHYVDGYPMYHLLIGHLFPMLSHLIDGIVLLYPMYNWLVVWNIFYFPIYWELSSQLTNIFQRG